MKYLAIIILVLILSCGTGGAISWVNPDAGPVDKRTSLGKVQESSGPYCREYLLTLNIDGEQQQGYGTACRQPDESWRIAMPTQGAWATRVTEVRYLQPNLYAGSPYRNHYRSGYWTPARFYLPYGYFGHNPGYGYGRHYSRHRSHDGYRNDLHRRGHGGWGSDYGHSGNWQHRRGHR